MTPCSCGIYHLDHGSLPLVGYQSYGGEVLELRNCTDCHSTRVTAVFEDASKCQGCGRVVRGTADDPKSCIEVEGVFCFNCGRRRERERRNERRGPITGPRAWPMLRDDASCV